MFVVPCEAARIVVMNSAKWPCQAHWLQTSDWQPLQVERMSAFLLRMRSHTDTSPRSPAGCVANVSANILSLKTRPRSASVVRFCASFLRFY